MAPSTVVELLRTHAAERPDAPAIHFQGATLSWAELDRRSSQVAQGLAAAGVGAGDRVAILDKNSAAFFELLFAATKLNAVVVGVNWRLAPPEMAAIIDDAGAAVLLVGSAFDGHVEQIEAQIPSVRLTLSLAGARWPSYDDWRDGHEPVDPGAEPTSSDVALQLYTSGTTGLPKGAMLTNRNLTVMVNEGEGHWGLGPDKVCLAAMPMFHIGGSGWALAALANGCPVVVLPEVDPVAILAAMPEFGVTHAFLVPAVLQLLVGLPEVEAADFSSLETIFYGASPITETALVRSVEVFGCGFGQLYGLTETTGAVVQLDAVDHDPVGRPHLLRSCGKPYPWVELRVAADASGAEAPVGESGELWIRSPMVMAGYWNRPEATAEAITADGWFRTGDIGLVDADGYVFLKDRLKDMIVSGAENVYPTEVENALAKHTAVGDVAVIGVPDAKWGEAVKAVVVVRPGETVTVDELVAFARQHVAGYKVPKSVDFVAELPRNPSGKILKRELRAPYWEGIERAIN